MPGVLVITSAAAVLHLAPILQEFPEFKPALVLPDDAWRVVDQVKKLGVAVILDPSRVYKPDTSIEIVPVRDYVDAGIAVALIPGDVLHAELRRLRLPPSPSSCARASRATPCCAA